MVSWLINSFVRDWDKVKDNTLPLDFYERDTLKVARELLGKLLVVRSCPQFPLGDPRSKTTIGRIVETEAYQGSDPASHSARGETPRCAVMFGDPGVAYVYFIYGMYEMLNFVTERKGYPGAVLIRALEPISGDSWMVQRRRGLPREQWTNGPGRLTQAMGITLSHNGQSLMGPALYVMDEDDHPPVVRMSGRVGIRVAMEVPWRFFIDGNQFVSKVPQNSKSILWHEKG